MKLLQHFLASARARVKANNPEAGFGEITKIAGAEWKALSKEDKQPFLQQHEVSLQAKNAYMMCAWLLAVMLHGNPAPSKTPFQPISSSIAIRHLQLQL